jgi:hypothetical protein
MRKLASGVLLGLAPGPARALDWVKGIWRRAADYATTEDLASIRPAIENVRTQVAESSGELRKAMNEPTWRLVAWVTTTMGLSSGLIDFIARHVD